MGTRLPSARRAGMGEGGTPLFFLRVRPFGFTFGFAFGDCFVRDRDRFTRFNKGGYRIADRKEIGFTHGARVCGLHAFLANALEVVREQCGAALIKVGGLLLHIDTGSGHAFKGFKVGIGNVHLLPALVFEANLH